MTKEEAIKYLLYRKSWLEVQCKNRSCKITVDSALKEIEAIKMAIEALVGQMPKKPTKHSDMKWDAVYGLYCPICGRSVLRFGTGGENPAKRASLRMRASNRLER